MEVSIDIFNRREIIERSEFLQADPERVMHEAMKEKLKLERRPQEFRDSSNMDCLLRKTAGCGESQARREPMCATGKPKWVWLPKPFRECILPLSV